MFVFFILSSSKKLEKQKREKLEKKLKLTHDAVGVLAVAHAPERVVLRAQVRADRVRQLVLGDLGVGRVVGHERARAAEAEEAVDDEHRAVLADVPVREQKKEFFVVFVMEFRVRERKERERESL